MKKQKNAVKATNPKMVPEKEAFDCLCHFAGKVIVSNRITRNMLGNFLESIGDDECEKTVIQAVTMLVVQDEDQRQVYVDHFHDYEFGMEIYDLAMDIREVLGLAGYDDFKTEEADI